jgi:type IV pilus assembly protein PilC
MRNSMSKLYRYQGIDQNGARKTGTYQTNSRKNCEQWLIANNIFPLNIARKIQPKITTKTLTTFCYQLAALVNANIALVEALNIINAENKHLNLQKLIGELKNDIENGNALSTALKKYPEIFNNFLCNLIYAGEKSGCLDNILQYIATYTEKTQTQKYLILKALLYPLTVLCVALAVTIILLVFVIPQFVAIFASFNAKLPFYTQLIIEIANFTKSYGVYMLWVIAFIIWLIVYFIKRSAKLQQLCDDFIFKLPIFGNFFKKTLICHFARTFAITFKAGIPILEALTITATIINNRIFQQKIINISHSIANGKALHLAMQEQNFFAPMILQFITIGEESGTLDDMLNKIASNYEYELNKVLDNLNKLLEPALMIFIGIVVGGLIIAMYLPIFRLGMQL